MKVGIIKLGSRISYGGRDTSGGNGEVRSIIKILQTADIEVNVFTKTLDKDDLIDSIAWYDINLGHEIVNDIGLDALLVINGNVNFFGGAEDRSQILNYHIINNFKGKVFYILCDPALQLKQIWPSIAKKPWGSKYKEKDINITRTDISYISQPYRVDLLIDIIKKNGIEINHASYFPFEKFPCLNSQLEPLPHNKLESDISYGGTMRGGKREKKMIEFYFGYSEDINVEMFGKIDSDDFNPKKVSSFREPRFSGSVKYDEFLPKMNKALSTVVIGDPLYEELEDINQRVYESIWAGVVTFIDAGFDTQKRVYTLDDDLKEFLYVTDRVDVEDKVNMLKMHPDFRKLVLEAQLKAVDFDAHKYSQQLKTILENHL